MVCEESVSGLVKDVSGEHVYQVSYQVLYSPDGDTIVFLDIEVVAQGSR